MCLSGNETEEDCSSGQLEVFGNKLELEALCELLSSTHRRHIIYGLERAETEVHDYEDLCTYLRNYEDTDVKREKFMADLHHIHCPKMEEIGVIDHDPRSRTIRYKGDLLVSRFVEQFADYELKE